MTVLPVTTMSSGLTPSARRFAWLVLRRRQVQAGDLAYHLSVGFLWERRHKVSAAQPGLDMNHRNAVIESRNGARGGRSCVALDDHGIRFGLREEGVKAVDSAGHDCRQRLTLPKDVQVMIGDNAEKLVDLIQHLAVLACDRHDAVENG